MRWFELRNFSHIYKKYEHILVNEEEMFILLRDGGMLYDKKNMVNDQPSCLVCTEQTTFLGRTRGYKNFCSTSCANIRRSETKNNKSETEKFKTMERGKKTKFIKYGDENYNNREKAFATMIEKYEYKTTMESPELFLKMKKTKLERYSDETYNNHTKRKETCLKKYGRESVFQVPFIKEKIYATNILKYGVAHVTQNKDILNKVNNTNISKYGVPWTFQSENNKMKSKITWLHKYGCHVSCSPIIKEKIFQKKLQLDENEMDSWDRARLKNEVCGRWIPLSEWSAFKLYSKNVWKITNKQELYTLEYFEKRGRELGDYHLDHMYSIFQGFKDCIPEEIIGNLCNLKMIDSRSNMSKNIKCSITKEELYEKFGLK